ncbi:hypothetical protein F4861DRAFT_180057 [Xylaria intraflava]|nr:hypothetical protein F4861DRAFT_180057 [Xylaria intraflava]
MRITYTTISNPYERADMLIKARSTTQERRRETPLRHLPPNPQRKNNKKGEPKKKRQKKKSPGSNSNTRARVFGEPPLRPIPSSGTPASAMAKRVQWSRLTPPQNPQSPPKCPPKVFFSGSNRFDHYTICVVGWMSFSAGTRTNGRLLRSISLLGGCLRYLLPNARSAIPRYLPTQCCLLFRLKEPYTYLINSILAHRSKRLGIFSPPPRAPNQPDSAQEVSERRRRVAPRAKYACYN